MSSDCTYNPSTQSPDTSHAKEQDRSPVTLRKLVREYARENPEIFAACCFGIGFVLGWKLKPW